MKNKKPLKIAGIVLAVLVVLLIGVDLFAGNFMVNYGIGRTSSSGNRTVKLDVEPPKNNAEQIIDQNMAIQEERTKAFLEKVECKETVITAEDKTVLTGFYFEQPQSNKPWVISIHGYKKDHESMLVYAEHFYNEGFNVLTPDLRACGKSGGKYVGMGWLDKEDIKGWITWILEKAPDARIIIQGHSMGGATTMMLSGETTPDNVVCFIEDCGYTTVWEIFTSELKLRFNLPPFPILTTASALAKSKAGYSFKQASAVKQIAKCTKPMLFFHGDADNFVPFSMLQTLYDAKPGNNKKMVVAEGAGHIRSVYLLGDEYWTEVFDFINTYLN